MCITLHAEVGILEKAEPLYFTRIVEIDENTHSFAALWREHGSQQSREAEWRKFTVGKVGWLSHCRVDGSKTRRIGECRAYTYAAPC